LLGDDGPATTSARAGSTNHRQATKAIALAPPITTNTA
jgi:hypothetical protein